LSFTDDDVVDDGDGDVDDDVVDDDDGDGATDHLGDDEVKIMTVILPTLIDANNKTDSDTAAIVALQGDGGAAMVKARSEQLWLYYWWYNSSFIIYLLVGPLQYIRWPSAKAAAAATCQKTHHEPLIISFLRKKYRPTPTGNTNRMTKKRKPTKGVLPKPSI